MASHSALLYALSPTAPAGPLPQSLGVARMPLFLVGEELRQGRLIRLLPEWRLPELGIFAVTTSRAYQPAKTRAFIDFFKDRLGDPPYWE